MIDGNDKFKVILKSRDKGKLGDGNISMNVTYHIPYRYLGELVEYLEKVRKSQDRIEKVKGVVMRKKKRK